MMDCGEDWSTSIENIRPQAIFITHAHPDHAGGLRNGTERLVYATSVAFEAMKTYPIKNRRTIDPGKPVTVDDITIEAFSVVHSLRAPAVGFRITAGAVAVFYIPDVIEIIDRSRALAGIKVFIGDGACLTRPLVRRRGDELFGHTTVRAQLGWCQQAGIKRAIFTHCGTPIVSGDPGTLEQELRKMGREHAVDARFAHDGLQVMLQ